MEYKGQLEGFPQEVVKKMVEHQHTQSNKRSVQAFEKDKYIGVNKGGFRRDNTPEGGKFWGDVIIERNFDLFFKKYPKERGKKILGRINLGRKKKVKVNNIPHYTSNKGLAQYPEEIAERLIKALINGGKLKFSSRRNVIANFASLANDLYWAGTKEGANFWKDIHAGNFKSFYLLYPNNKSKSNTLTSKNNKEDETTRIITTDRSREGKAIDLRSGRRRQRSIGRRPKGNITKTKIRETKSKRGKISGCIRTR